MGLAGHEAVLAWRIESGRWGSVALDGLSVVAVVQASATLGDPYGNPFPAKTVFLVDERASEVQRSALVHFAQSQTRGLPAPSIPSPPGRDERLPSTEFTPIPQARDEGIRASKAGLLDDVVAVEPAPIRFTVDPSRHGKVTLEAGSLARLTTRAIGDADKFCHNEEVYYQPLALNLKHAMPAVATEGSYRGNHLGVTWVESERRGSFVATFTL